MYPEVNAQRARLNMTLAQIAEDPRIDCTLSTLSQKLSGKAPLTLKEAKALKEVLKSELPLEELFRVGDE